MSAFEANISNISTTSSQILSIATKSSNGSDSIILDTFMSLFWYIIGSIIFCICCVSCLLLWYIHQTRRHNNDNKKNSIQRPISESLKDRDIHYHHSVAIQSNTSKHKLIIAAPINNKTSEHRNHSKSFKNSRMMSAFTTISALTGFQSPKSPTNTSTTCSANTTSTTNLTRNSRKSGKNKGNGKTKKTQNSKQNQRKKSKNDYNRRHKQSQNSSTTCDSSSESEDYDDDEDDGYEDEYEEEEEESTSSRSTTSASTATNTRTQTPDGVGEGGDIYHDTKFPDTVISVGSSLATETTGTMTFTHTKNPLSLSTFSGIDSDGIDIQSFVEENMPTIPELDNDHNSSLDSTLNSSPSPRSAAHSESESHSRESQPVRKMTYFNKEPVPYLVHTHNGYKKQETNDKIKALNQDLNGNGNTDKSKRKNKANDTNSNPGSNRVSTVSEDDVTEEEKRMEPLEEQMRFAQEFLDKQQEVYMKYETNQDDEDSEADLKSETPDTADSDTNDEHYPLTQNVPLSIFSALSAVSMKMKQFETNDMIPNGNLTSLNAEPSIYESDTNEYPCTPYSDGEKCDVRDRFKYTYDGSRDSDDSSMDNDHSIIAIMKKKKKQNQILDDDGRPRHDTTHSAASGSTMVNENII